MSKFRKLLIIVFFVLVILSIVPTLIYYQDAVDLPFRIGNLESVRYIGEYVPVSMFWIAACVCVVSILWVIGVFFTSNKKLSYTFKTSKGMLTIEKNAVQGFVQSILEDYDFVGKPNVKVHLKKHTADIDVHAQLKRTSELYGKHEVIAQRIEQELADLMGVKDKITIRVRYTGYSQKTESTSRVQ